MFLLFDQLQRHEASRAVSVSARAHPEAFKEIAKWVASREFGEELERAQLAPESAQAKALLKRIQPHIRTSSTKVPYSAAQRKSSMSHLWSMTYHYGLPTVFFTFAPFDTTGLWNLRMSFPQHSNQGFPADPGGFAEALCGGSDTYIDIPITWPALQKLLANNPAAAAEVFRLMVSDLFEILLGLKPDKDSKRTAPEPRQGVFGTALSAFGVSEEQGRGTLHMHLLFWGGLPAEVLQRAAADTGGLHLQCSILVALRERS
jgi:hypothetical protein